MAFIPDPTIGGDGFDDFAFAALGVAAWVAYLPAALETGWHPGKAALAFLGGAPFPWWGVIGMLTGFFFGGPLLCTCLWCLFLMPTLGVRPARWVIGAGLVSNLIAGGAALASEAIAPSGPAMSVFMPVAAVGWHVCHAVGLRLAARERRRWIERRAACSSCGYDTAGLPARVCPECGSAFADEPPAVGDVG